MMPIDHFYLWLQFKLLLWAKSFNTKLSQMMCFDMIEKKFWSTKGEDWIPTLVSKTDKILFCLPM